MFWLMIFVLVALAISAFCSLLEATLLSYTPSQAAELTTRHPRIGAIWQHFKSHIERPIAVILILNTAAHTVGATLAGAEFERVFGNQWIFTFSLVFTYIMLQFTEILPKTLGVRYNARIAPLMALPLSIAVRLLAPVIWLIHLVNRPFEGRRETQRVATLEEISALAGLARLSNLIGSHEERIIRGASQLHTTPLLEIMIPYEQVSVISTGQTLSEALVSAHADPHTRFPVHEAGNRDQIVGYVNFKELIYFMRTNPNDQSLLGIIRPVYFVRYDRPATELLRVFVDQHYHIAIVLDERQKPLGLITLEDLVEELLGELEDEFDRLPRMLQPLSGGTWMVGGGVPIAQVAEKLGVDLPDASGTTSAWLIRRLGHVPQPNDVYRQDGLSFLVRRMRRGKVFEVSITQGPVTS